MDREIERLTEENNRLKAQRQREDEARWDEVKENMKMIPEIKSKLEALDISINGSDGEPQKGMKVRVDRLEQKEVQRSWILGALATTTLGLLATTIWHRITGKTP